MEGSGCLFYRLFLLAQGAIGRLERARGRKRELVANGSLPHSYLFTTIKRVTGDKAEVVELRRRSRASLFQARSVSWGVARKTGERKTNRREAL